MANHKSAIKRIRSSEVKRDRNKYIHKTTRNAIRKFKATTDKKEAAVQFPLVVALIDRLVKKHIIHKNKGGNLKSQMNKYLSSL